MVLRSIGTDWASIWPRDMDHPRIRNAKWLFFDLGETLVDERPALFEWTKSCVTLLDGIGVSATAEDLDQAIRNAATDFDPKAMLTGVMALSGGLLNAEIIRRDTSMPTDLLVLFPDVEDLLATLSQRYSLGIVANQSPDTIKRCEDWGIARYFEFILGSADVGLAKPDPAIFQMALNQAGCTGGEAVMIGDRLDNDIRPARKFGLSTIRVLQGYYTGQQPRDDIDVADITIPGIAELASIFD